MSYLQVYCSDSDQTIAITLHILLFTGEKIVSASVRQCDKLKDNREAAARIDRRNAKKIIVFNN